MTIETELTLIATFVSAFCAIVTTYLYRSQGKGFVWVKNLSCDLQVLSDERIHLAVRFPIYNLGKGMIRFQKLRAKKVNLKSSSVENYELEMHEAYFPEGVEITTYKAPVFSELNRDPQSKLATAVHVEIMTGESTQTIPQTNVINKKLESIGEVIFILRCDYKDGSWFGCKTRTTTIGLVMNGLDVTFLSTKKRKELQNLFS